MHTQEELNSGRDLAPHFCLESEIIISLAYTNCLFLTRIAMTDEFWILKALVYVDAPTELTKNNRDICSFRTDSRTVSTNAVQ